MTAIGRNEPCPCGSGKKYKRCCLLKSQKMSLKTKVAIGLLIVVFGIGAIAALSSLGELGEGCPPGRVWSAEHRHCH